MLQILEPSSAGELHFVGGLRVDPDPDDPDAFRVRCRARFELADAVDAESWEECFPGAMAKYSLATEEDADVLWPADRWKRTGGHSLVLDLSQPTKGGPDLGIRAPAIVDSATLKLSSKAQRVDCNLTIAGVSPSDLGTLAQMLCGTVNVGSAEQMGLFDTDTDTAGAPLPPEAQA